MLSSFEIENFRAFRRISLPQLGHVNLIVGRNNTGKTMLLEALRLHAARGSEATIRQLLAERDELQRFGQAGAETLSLARLEFLFHGRQMLEGSPVIRLGPVRPKEAILQITPVRMVLRPGMEWEIISQDRSAGMTEHHLASTLGLAISYGDEDKRPMPPNVIRGSLGLRLFSGGKDREENITYVPSGGLAAEVLTEWWDAVALTDAEERITRCLQIIAPVQRINLVGRPGSEGERMVVVKLEGESQPVPLRSLGDGVSKMFSFALALEAARGSGLLLIDEIENGIHYAAHEDLWRFLITAASRAGVQVFATTHSWDCVMGFQAALGAHPDLPACAIRLYRGEEQIDAVVLDREEIAVATRDQVDFR